MTKRKTKIILITILVALLVVGGIGLWWYVQKRTEAGMSTQQKSVVEQVARIFVLPTDEKPAILTVVNKDEITSAFLQGKVEDGDKVLIYQQNQKVIIYRPSLDKIIDAGPAVVDDVETSL